MNLLPHSQPPPDSTLARLRETRDAFDSVAPDYDGPRGNNSLIQDMRSEMWRWLDLVFPQPSRLIDLGCGTGLDAVRMARVGHFVTATDWSPLMVQRTQHRVECERLSERVQVVVVGGQDLQRLDGSTPMTACIPILARSTACRTCAMSPGNARLVRPGGKLVFTVVGRTALGNCPLSAAR
jgi:ubiquinone/menaquinone biosynthesis C-methylase UbiE